MLGALKRTKQKASAWFEIFLYAAGLENPIEKLIHQRDQDERIVQHFP